MTPSRAVMAEPERPATSAEVEVRADTVDQQTEDQDRPAVEETTRRALQRPRWVGRVRLPHDGSLRCAGPTTGEAGA